MSDYEIWRMIMSKPLTFTGPGMGLFSISQAVSHTVSRSAYHEWQLEPLETKHEKLVELFAQLLEKLHERCVLNDEEVQEFLSYEFSPVKE